MRGSLHGLSGVRLRLLALAAIAIALLPVSAFASDITFESKIEDGFGRLVITFPDRKPVPKYDARISNGVFILTFDEEADIALTDKPLGLDAYFSIVRRDPDMKAFRFGLGRAVRVNTQVAAERLFVDFLPPNWVGLPPSLPPQVVAELTQRAEDALLAAKRAAAKNQVFTVTPKLDLRIGRTPTFTRIAFRWNVPFDANFTRSDDGVAILFNRTDNPDLAKINVDPPPLLKKIVKREIEDGMSIVLSVDPRAMVRAFRADDAYVVDLTSNAMQVDARDALSKVTPELLRQPDLNEMVVIPGADSPNGTQADKAPPPPPATPGPSALAVPPEYAAAHSPPPALPAPATAAAAVEAPAPAVPEAEHGMAVLAPTEEVKPPPTESVMSAGDLTPVLTRMVQSGATDQIVLPFGAPTAAAVFRRGDDLWIVVDSSASIDIEPIRAGLGARIASVEHAPVEGGQALRITLKSAQLISVVQNGNEWLIALGDNVIGSTQRVDLVRGLRPDGKTILTADFRDPGAVHRLHDPATGDDLIVVTGKGPARGLLVPQDFVELSAVPSAHGLVVVPRADDIEVTPAGSQVVIGRKNGLALSQLKESPASAAPPKGDPERPGFINIKRWTALPAGDYVETVKEMQGAIAAANEDDRPGRRMVLADLYLSRQFGPESLGLLSLAAEENPALRSMIGYRLTMLAAEVLSGHFPEAWTRANDEGLAKDPDAALWRAIAGAPMREWDAIVAASAPAESVIDNYPDFVQEQYLLALAEAQVEHGSFEQADTTLTRFDRIDVSTPGAAKRAMLMARVAEADGRTGDAAGDYKKAIAFGPGPTESEAEYRLATMSYKAGLIPPAEAEAKFETLSMTWRGDDLELKSLDQFTVLKVADKDYRQAFVAMRSAQHANGESPITDVITNRMSGVFANLFLEGKADELKPVEALSLYYDYRELTPIGRRGDDMVRKLADRLVSVDLLEQAAELLQHQIDNRLRGAARAQIAADLAVVYLLDRRPTEALQIIRRTEQAQLPMLLDRQRRIVEARALADLKETRSALDLLSSMEGDDISRMRAEILWAASDWRGLASQVERMMGGRWSDELPLNDRERRDVLRAGIAYALVDDTFGLERVRKKYLAKMADGPDGAAFDAVTRPIEVESVEFKEIVKETAASDTMGAFLTDYRARYLNGAPDKPGTDSVVTSGIGG